VPEALKGALPLLEAIIADTGTAFPEPHRFDDATWVGYRLAEILPIPSLARQRLLELDDTLSRLEIIHQYLKQHNLLGARSGAVRACSTARRWGSPTRTQQDGVMPTLRRRLGSRG
jgi:hypothetical protein